MRKQTLNVVRISLPVLAIAILFVVIMGISLPANAQYNRIFKSKDTMLMDQATFEGMKVQLDLLWNQMNTTFSGYNFEFTYNNPWYWLQTYDNSLKAQEDYFRQLRSRFDEAIAEKNVILAGNKTILGPYSQWYQQTLDSLRAEMKREGGVTWVIFGAWYLHFAPLAFWSLYLLLGIDIPILLIWVYTLEMEGPALWVCSNCHARVERPETYLSIDGRCPKCGSRSLENIEESGS